MMTANEHLNTTAAHKHTHSETNRHIFQM